jgi:hypothetical protein
MRPNKRVGGVVDISLLQFCPGNSPGKSLAKSPLATPKQGKSAGSLVGGNLPSARIETAYTHNGEKAIFDQ